VRKQAKVDLRIKLTGW